MDEKLNSISFTDTELGDLASAVVCMIGHVEDNPCTGPSPLPRYEALLERLTEIADGEWVVSQQFHGAGLFILHKPGGNRPCKIAYGTREKMQEIADLLNAHTPPIHH